MIFQLAFSTLAAHLGHVDAPFIVWMQWVMKPVAWDEENICIDDKLQSNPRFADGTVFFSRGTAEAERMINNLYGPKKIAHKQEGDQIHGKSMVWRLSDRIVQLFYYGDLFARIP